MPPLGSDQKVSHLGSGPDLVDARIEVGQIESLRGVHSMAAVAAHRIRRAERPVVPFQGDRPHAVQPLVG